MSLRKPAGLISFVLLFCLLAGYSRRFLGEGQDLLVRTWSLDFHRLGADCIFWIALRLAGWISVYLCLLRLEGGFAVWLFLRRRSFLRVYMRTFAGCLGRVLRYYGLGTFVMALCHWAVEPGADLGRLLCQDGLWGILAGECLGGISFCLAAYLAYCLSGKAEAGFLAALAGRLLWGFAAGGVRTGPPVRAAICCVLAGIAFGAAERNFRRKMGDVQDG